MANASSDPAAAAKGANALTEVTGADELELQTKGKFSFVDELLRMVSAEPAVEETFDRSALNVALLVVTFSSKCTTWATPCVGARTKIAANEATPVNNRIVRRSSPLAKLAELFSKSESNPWRAADYIVVPFAIWKSRFRRIGYRCGRQ